MSESDGPPRTKLDAFDAVYEREFSYVWKTVGRLGVASADIADAVHDVYVVAYRRWSELEPGRPVRPWLFGIARRVAAGKRRRARDVLDNSVERSSTGDADRLAQRDLLWRLLSELPDERLEVVILHDLEGLSGADIAAALGISVNTVHSRLRLARSDLADALARLGEKKR